MAALVELGMKVPLYITQAMSKDGHLIICSICTDRELAETHRKVLVGENDRRGYLKIWTEKVTGNHLYAEMFKF